VHISHRGLEIIKGFEGLEDGDPSTVLLDPYLDPVGLPTIGWGHLIKPGEDFTGGITLARAEALLREDVEPVEEAVGLLVERRLKQCQFDALVSFTFNVGTGAFNASTLLEWLNDGRPDADMPMQLTQWRKSKGRSLAGLAKRRCRESLLFLD
jgi:lysozyme